MLGLKMATDPRWVDLANMELEEVLTDHAYCELKAATACISLVQMYPERKELVEQLAPVVTEEWGHFRMVLKELNDRGYSLGRQRKDHYVNELLALIKKTSNQTERLVDRLLVCALIEARSCERFRLLSIELPDEKLKQFYHQFMIAEAGHYKMFIELARLYGKDFKVDERWNELLSQEVQLLEKLELRGDRMH